MPIYEYACEKCGTTTEALRKMDDGDAPLACEQCGSDQTKRTHSVFAAGHSARGGNVPLPMGAPGAPGMGAPGMGGCACGDPTGPCNI